MKEEGKKDEYDNVDHDEDGNTIFLFANNICKLSTDRCREPQLVEHTTCDWKDEGSNSG